METPPCGRGSSVNAGDMFINEWWCMMCCVLTKSTSAALAAVKKPPHSAVLHCTNLLVSGK